MSIIKKKDVKKKNKEDQRNKQIYEGFLLVPKILQHATPTQVKFILRSPHTFVDFQVICWYVIAADRIDSRIKKTCDAVSSESWLS